MNGAMASAERAREVRRAARAWEKAGWIDTLRRSEIEKLHADSRVRLGWALRVLVGGFTWFAIGSGFGFLMAMAQGWSGDRIAFPLLVLAVLCLVGAEVAHLGLRTSGMGADDALEITALGSFLAGWALLLDWDHESAMVGIFLLGAALAVLAAWRWGGWLYGALASAGWFAALARLPQPRLLWCVCGAASAAALLWLGDRARLAPSQRVAARTAMVIALGALYVALNYASAEHSVLELSLSNGDDVAPDLWLPIGGLATALLPVLVLALGIRRRDRLLLGCGLLLAAASLVTLRWYVHLMPLWTLLLLAGAVLGGVALALRRWLDGGASRERAGFTAEPLLEGGRRQLGEIAASVAAFTPSARVQVESPAGFQGGGGEAGGGGATSEF